MIARLRGQVLALIPGGLVVEAGPVAVEMRTTAATAQSYPVGSAVVLWTHLAIRELGWDLYGFEQREARDLFRLVQRVPQVGAKTALAMLGVFSVPVLLRVIAESDVRALTTVPGIGKKSAERIVVELRDLFAELALAPDPSGGSSSSPHGFEAVQALIGLGYTPAEAQRRIGKAVEEGVAPHDVEALIRAVLLQEAP